MIADVRTVIWKEWKEILLMRGSRRSGLWSALIMLGVFGVFLPVQFGRDWVEAPAALIYWAWVPLFLVIGVIADSFAGERERHTLETLLARRCYSMFFEELRALPEMCSSLATLGFYMAGFNWFVDTLISPAIMLALRLWPTRAVKPMGRLLCWGTRQFSAPPYGVLVKVEAAGERDGRPVKVQVAVSHPDGYELTAIPVVACLRQYLDGTARKPGLWMMGHLVDPARLVAIRWTRTAIGDQGNPRSGFPKHSRRL